MKTSTISLNLQWLSQRLEELHRAMQTKALLGRIYSFLTGHSTSLLDLAEEVSERKIRRQYYAGSRTVPIKRIKGSEGRSGDFDSDFNPRNARTMDRWLSVADAYSHGATLPAIELIQLGEDYFVRDGHHRVSVSRAFGEEYIDARVTVLELEPVSGQLPTLVAANTPDR
jgi:hypothetical protein